jgi:cell division protein FtsB
LRKDNIETQIRIEKAEKELEERTARVVAIEKRIKELQKKLREGSVKSRKV